MRKFVALFDSIDQTQSSNEKVLHIKNYFASCSDEDGAWALFFLCGHRLKRFISSRMLLLWSLELINLPSWLIDESYASVGDTAETISLLLPRKEEIKNEFSLSEWMEVIIKPLQALTLEEKKTLIVADIHIGKGTVFRKAGIPIPQRIMANDLMNIAHLIDQWQAEKCIIVGDLIHAETGLSEEVRKKFSEWLHKLPCKIHLIIGNHDRALLKNLPPEWPLNIHKEGLLCEPFYFSHYPKQHDPWFVWSGHLHPKVEIRNAFDRLVLCCFQIFPDLAIMPAFGFFVGGAFIKKSDECKIYAIADDAVIEI